MDESPRVHHRHHKSKHSRSLSRRGNNEESTLQNNDKSICIDEVKNSNENDVSVVEQNSANNSTTVIEPKIELNDYSIEDVDAAIQGNSNEEKKGIAGYVEREIKTLKKPQSFSDPTASPGQRSTRSRTSIEKSPRQKRSKSESRRRRERKLIAAGELEVRQANETLMRYLKQCSEINDASLSGELEIDKSIDDRRVNRRTKSQRQRRNIHGIGTNRNLSSSKLPFIGGLRNGCDEEPQIFMRDQMPPNEFGRMLRDLNSEIIPDHGEIYNPFTPVVSPTDGPSVRSDKMFVQTSNGFRPVNDSSYFKASMHDDPESNRPSSITSVSVSCSVQQTWILMSNICHGLLAGLALAHLLFVISTKPGDWIEGSIKHYASFVEIYTNTFYFLAIICMVSIFDRMDICRWNVFSSAESISFRWIIIVMIYIGMIILCLSAESFNDRIYNTANVNISTIQREMDKNRVIHMWNSLSLARSMSAVIGWILIGISPSEDMLYYNLANMDKYYLANN